MHVTLNLQYSPPPPQCDSTQHYMFILITHYHKIKKKVTFLLLDNSSFPNTRHRSLPNVMAHIAIKPLHWFMGYFSNHVLYILTYFCSVNFQLSTNKVVVVELLPLVQKWKGGNLINVDNFKLLCQLILWSYILVTGLLKVTKTHHLHCDVMSAELFTCIWFF